MTIEERNKLVEDNLSLVNYVLDLVFRIDRSNPSYEDYQQEGRYALMLAAEAWNKTQRPFRAYAYLRIKWHLIKVSQSISGMIRIPLYVWEKVGPIVTDTRRELSVDEVSELSNCTPLEIQHVLMALDVGSLDDPINVDDDITHIDTLIDEDTNRFSDDIVERIHVKNCIEYTISKFPTEWHKDLIARYFSDIMNGRRVTFKEYGAIYSRSDARCIYLIRRAYSIFRRAYHSGIFKTFH